MTAPTRYIYATAAGVYATDGTDAGTTLLVAAGADFVPQPATQMITLANGKVLFFGLVNPSLDPIGAVTSGIRIWETDGTVAGTTQTGTTVPPDGLSIAGDSISNVVAIGNQIAFTYQIPGSNPATAASLVTDGTTAGTSYQNTTLLPPFGLPGTGALTGVSCFLPGTGIATPSGETAIQDLRAGDEVLTQTGSARIVWIGRRTVAAAGAAQHPVRLRAHALGAGVPARDLFVSPDHALFLDGVLVPAQHLVNGASIAREPLAEITYLHLLLDRHDIILAEGAPAESLLADGLDPDFDNIYEAPVFTRSMVPVAPRITQGPQLQGILHRLNSLLTI
jgi:hypothetical protein